jgi:hypothetical protein
MFRKAVTYLCLRRPLYSFFQRIGADTAANAAIIPAMAPVAKQALGMSTIPDAVFSALMGTSAKIAKAIAPNTVPKI